MPLLIALPDSAEHARRLGARLGIPVVTPEIRQFPDGEIYVRIDPLEAASSSLSPLEAASSSLSPLEAASFDSVAIVGNLVHDNFLKIAFLAGTARDLGATKVGLVAPYLAYMRQDAVFRAGEGVTARYFGKLVSSTIDWLVTVDPHLHRYDSLASVYSIPTVIARAAASIADWVAAEIEQPVLVGPDAESVQWVAAVAERCGAPYLILEKTRRGDRDVSITAPAHAWNGHTPVVIDDIVSTGRTMVEATRQLRAAGAAAPICVAIHAVFADAVSDELVAAGARGIVTCDTLVHASNRICVDAPIADAIRELIR